MASEVDRLETQILAWHRADATATLTRSGRALRLVQDDGALPGAAPDRSLLRMLVKARAW